MVVANCEKFLKRWGIPDHLTCILSNLDVGQGTTVRTWHGTMNWVKIGKGICQGCILSPCLVNIYVEYIMWNTRLKSRLLGEISTTSYIAEETTLMAQNEEELKTFLMRVKEQSENTDLKLYIQKSMIMAFFPKASWKMDGEKWKQ